MRLATYLKYAWLVCFCLFTSLSHAAPSVQVINNKGADKVITLPPLASSVTINEGVSYQIEKRSMNFETVATSPESDWIPYTGQVVNFQIQKNPVWLRYSVYNSMENSNEWLLMVRFPYIEHIEVIVHHPEENRWDAPLISGLMVPMQLRPIAHRNFLFPLTLNAGQKTTIYIRAISRAKLVIPMIFWKKELFPEKDSHHIMILGLYFGVLGIMLLYNLSLFTFTQDKSFFFYSLYIFTIIFYLLMSTGIGPLYLWDKFYWFKIHSYGVLSSICYASAILFTRHFLSLKKYGGLVLHFNTLLLILWSAFIVLYLFSMDSFLVKSEEMLALVTNCIGTYTGIYLWRQGNISARYFTIGWGILIICTFILLFGLMGILEFNWLTTYSQMIGFIFELILLSFALADRFRRERAAREEAQQIALKVTQKISRELEKRVHERTIDLKKTMLRLKKVNQELSQLNITDGLTKVHNRRHFDKVIANEVKRANRTLQPLAVVMVDIDHFKKINDTHGHPVGDKCLYLVAQTLKQQMARSLDLVARYGGEEFALILTATPREKAIAHAEKVRRSVEKLTLLNKGTPIKLTVSLGVAAWIPQQNESAENLIKAADQALYKAKHSGRNQVIASPIVKNMGSHHPKRQAIAIKKRQDPVL